MDLWNLRTRASEAIDQSLKQESLAVEDAIALLEKIAHRLIEISNEGGSESSFATICAQTVAKAYRLSLASYSLCLDGLVVEGRPLIRLLFEAWQLLAYFREEPSRVQQVFEGKLPKAGEIAKKLKDEMHGQLKGLRDYLNDNGSHMSFEEDALVSMMVPFSVEQTKECFRPIFSLTMFAVYESARCLDILGRMDTVLADEILNCKEKGLNLFSEEVA